MNHSVIVLLVLLTFAFSGCDETVQQPAPNSGVELVQQNDTPASGESPIEVTPSKQDNIVFGDKFPEVLAVKAASISDTSWRFNVTLSSLYDSPERYADAWRVLDSRGNELGIRVLGHDHAGEQPFTRAGTVQVPNDIYTVFIEGRDQTNGWSGQRFEVTLPTTAMDK